MTGAEIFHLSLFMFTCFALCNVEYVTGTDGEGEAMSTERRDGAFCGVTGGPFGCRRCAAGEGRRGGPRQDRAGGENSRMCLCVRVCVLSLREVDGCLDS